MNKNAVMNRCILEGMVDYLTPEARRLYDDLISRGYLPDTAIIVLESFMREEELYECPRQHK